MEKVNEAIAIWWWWRYTGELLETGPRVVAKGQSGVSAEIE
jgi:hypothetical protein